MKRDLIDAIGKIDPRYIEEAAEYHQGTARSLGHQAGRGARPSEGEHEVQPVRRRSGWAVAAAALFLVLSLGTGWLVLSGRNVTGADASNNPADTPGHSEETLLTSTETKEDPSDTREDLPPAEDSGRNALDLDFDAVIAAADSEEVAEACKYLRALTPSAKNEMTGLFAGKNLILITAQSFAPEVIDPDRTPTLYRLATQGIEFTDYYQPAWGEGTASGEFSILAGLYPGQGARSLLALLGKNTGFTLADQLRRQGYFTRAYCNYDYQYLHRRYAYENLGYEQFIGIGNGLEEGVARTWPYSDQAMIDYTIGQYLDRQPFTVCYMTCSGQGPYAWFANQMAEKHRSEVEDLNCSDPVKAYLAANMEVENALRDLVAALEDAGIADDTVIVLTSPEYPYALEESEDYGNTEDYLAELYGKPAETCFERDHSALIIWSGCLEGKGYEVTTPTSSLDILPTLSNLFGLEYDSRLFVGRDVFSDQEPLVFWPDGSWRTDRASYNAAAGEYAAVGAGEPYTDVMDLHDAVENKIRYSKAALGTDLLSLLLPEREALWDAPLRFPYGPDPCEVVQEAIYWESDMDYTISLTVEEVREDEAEKQKLFARDPSCAAARDGFGADLLDLIELDPEDVTVVYARYTAEYDHTKVPYLDGNLDQYFCLTRGEDGNWSIFTFTSTASVDPNGTGTVDPAETIDAEPHLPPEMSMEELEAKLGYGWKLPEAGTWPGEIVSKFDDSLGENGGILLEYHFDGFVVYAAKYADDGTDAYESWSQDSAERGSELIDGVEIRFLGEPTVPDAIDTAIWKRDGYQYILNCATAPGVDLMTILPLFMDDE